MTVLLLATPVGALHVEAGSLRSNSTNNCKADAGSNQEYTMDPEALTVKTNVVINEWSSKKDLWKGFLNVEWTQYPGLTPGDDGDSDLWVDLQGSTQNYDDWLSVSWAAALFQEAGTYRASVSIEIEWWEASWGSSQFTKMCSQSDDMQLTINIAEDPPPEPPGCTVIANGQCVVVV